MADRKYWYTFTWGIWVQAQSSYIYLGILLGYINTKFGLDPFRQLKFEWIRSRNQEKKQEI